MSFFESFRNEAAESYKSLPDETNVLYKRHHIPIGGLTCAVPADDSAALADYATHNSGMLATGFSCMVGSASHLIDDGHVRISAPEDSNSLMGMMHNSKEDRYVAYINAYSDRVISIEVGSGEKVELNMLFLNTGPRQLSHMFINAGDGSSLKIVETHMSIMGNPTVSGIIREIRSGSNASIEIDAIHNEGSNVTALGFARNSIGDDSKLSYNSFYNGAERTRTRNAISAGHGCSVSVNEIMFGSGMQKFDISTRILNSGRQSMASLESRAVVMDSAFCIMKGYAQVLNGAAKSKSYVHERGIILDRQARVDGLPDMSVDESDVKATHSSATAPIDPESVFYLASRGVEEIGVRRLIVSGFLGEGITKMHDGLARRTAVALVNRKLDSKEFGHVPDVKKEGRWSFEEDKERDIFKGHYKYR